MPHNTDSYLYSFEEQNQSYVQALEQGRIFGLLKSDCLELQHQAIATLSVLAQDGKRFLKLPKIKFSQKALK